jgi:prolyl-tRNA editing enzyme YbaK/EbsC (Cys-tRNA(Pro) deacylase)
MNEMGTFKLGSLSSVPASGRPDLLAEPTLRALAAAGLLDDVGVVEIDPALSDTVTTQQEFGVEPDSLANCVVVGGKREGIERLAACVVLATTRADINKVVKRLLDVRKASFLPMARATELTDMEYGGITAFRPSGPCSSTVGLSRPMSFSSGPGCAAPRSCSPERCSPDYRVSG